MDVLQRKEVAGDDGSNVQVSATLGCQVLALCPLISEALVLGTAPCGGPVWRAGRALSNQPESDVRLVSGKDGKCTAGTDSTEPRLPRRVAAVLDNCVFRERLRVLRLLRVLRALTVLRVLRVLRLLRVLRALRAFYVCVFWV
jgi:hypothetical protein